MGENYLVCFFDILMYIDWIVIVEFEYGLMLCVENCFLGVVVIDGLLVESWFGIFNSFDFMLFIYCWLFCFIFFDVEEVW